MDGDQTGFHGRYLVGDNTVLVATDGETEGYVYAFAIDTGHVLWKRGMGSPVPSDVVGHGELAFVVTRSDSLLALELRTGSVRWRFGSLRERRFDRFLSSPVIVGDRVVMSGRDGVVYAVNAASGALAWEYEVGGRTTVPVAATDVVYVGVLGDNRVIALAGSTGTQLAEAQVSSALVEFIAPVVCEGGLIVAAEATVELWTKDLDRILWKVETFARISRAPTEWQHDIVGGTVSGLVLRYQARDGAATVAAQLGDVVAGLAGADDDLYVGTQKGTLYALGP